MPVNAENGGMSRHVCLFCINVCFYLFVHCLVESMLLVSYSGLDKTMFCGEKEISTSEVQISVNVLENWRTHLSREGHWELPLIDLRRAVHSKPALRHPQYNNFTYHHQSPQPHKQFRFLFLFYIFSFVFVAASFGRGFILFDFL